MLPRWFTPTTCLACAQDAQERDAGLLCPYCRAQRRAETEDHPGACACERCRHWETLDIHALRMGARAAETVLDAEVSA